jgi:taurine dioxygenase
MPETLVEIVKLNGPLAARVTGIDWDAGLRDRDVDVIGDALLEHGVLAVAARDMRPEQHVQLASSFGELEHHEFFDNQGPGFEHITVLDSARGDRSNMWHIDEQFLEKPPIITMTRAIQLPVWGGDTAFISLHAAHDSLSPRMQQYLDGLEAVHDLARIAEMRWQGGTGTPADLADELRTGKQATHPVVRVHPVTGRPALYVSPTYTRFIRGLPMAESKAILDFLFLHLQRPEHGYRHVWSPGDMLVWDNRSVMHHAVADYADRRVMHRISVIGPA